MNSYSNDDSDNDFTQSQNSYVCSKTLPENRAAYDIMWKTMTKSDRSQTTIIT